MEEMTVKEIQEILANRPDIVELLETAKDASPEEIAKAASVIEDTGYYNAEPGTDDRGTPCYFYHSTKGAAMYWVDYPDRIGDLTVTFDKKHFYNLWTDYPEHFTPDELAVFNSEEPYWKEFFTGEKGAKE